MPFSIWWALPGFVGLIGILLLVSGLGRLFKLQLVGGGFRFLFGGVVLGAAAVVALVGLNLQTYARLTHEQLAAIVTLKQTGPDAYTASVARADSKGALQAPKDYPLTGDAFRMEADVIVFQPWANIVGADALYRFNRIQGRWDSETKENTQPPTSFSMRDAAGLDIFRLPLGKANPLKHVDAEFLGGIAQPMADGAVYEVKMSQKGLIVRPTNEAANKAIDAHREKMANMPAEPGPPAVDLNKPGPVQLPTPTPAPTH